MTKCVHDDFGNTIKVSDGGGLKYKLGYPTVRLKIEPSVPGIFYHYTELLGVFMVGI